jgi:hypothetical protein
MPTPLSIEALDLRTMPELALYAASTCIDAAIEDDPGTSTYSPTRALARDRYLTNVLRIAQKKNDGVKARWMRLIEEAVYTTHDSNRCMEAFAEFGSHVPQTSPPQVQELPVTK